MRRLRVAFVVQRYGLEVNGGAELYCRWIAERMARHHEVEVLTSRAIDYVTWKDEYPDTPVAINGVLVRRFGVDSPRKTRVFDALSQDVLTGPHSVEDEVSWMKAQGPYSTKLLEYLQHNRNAYDVFVFVTYLYCTTYFGMPIVAERSLFIPTAHDELPIYLSIFDRIFQAARYFAYLTPEEELFLSRRFFDCNLKGEILGIGLDPVQDPSPDPEWDQIRRTLGTGPFILYVGRIDESKGCRTLIEYFDRFTAESSLPDLKLLLLGKPVMPVAEHKQIVCPGFVSDTTKIHAIRACRFMVAPSPFESLCIAALEAWQLGIPVLANGNCAVLRGQCMRSNGGLWYSDYEEFREAALCLLEDNVLASNLGRQGADFVNRNYTWEQVEGKLLRILQSVAADAASGTAQYEARHTVGV